jgi:hypothetical protein
MNRRRIASRTRIGAGIVAAGIVSLAVIACGVEEPEPDGTTGGAAGSGGSGGLVGKGGTSGAAGGAVTAGMSNATGGTATGVGGTGTGGTGVTPGTGGTISPAGGSGNAAGTGATMSGAGGSAGSDVPVGGTGGSAGSAGAAGSGGVAHMRDHCVDGFAPSPLDADMIDGPAEFVQSGQTDLTVQPEVIQWMEDHEWQAAHFEWHSIRRCNGGGSMSRINVCQHTDMIPTDQECKSDGDGLQFLAMHRHMIQSLKQLFPNHQEQFDGFETFPQSAEDVPQQWRADWRAFSSTELANAKIADEIAKPENLSRFPTEGAFGRWLQCMAPTYSGLHGSLHFKWVRTQNTTHGLGNQFTNIDNYMFWKLHGWIDKVWEKYRVAKGLTPDDPALKDMVLQQCREMDKLATLVDPNTPDPDAQPLPPESGVFHTMVRPMFEASNTKCSGCHGPQAPEAGMTLGGHVSSADIYANIVNVPSIHGGQFMRIKPGDPSQSWLYLKAAGMASAAGCTPTNGNTCNPQVMPPSDDAQDRATTAQLNALRDWIMAGAPAPTSP